MPNIKYIQHDGVETVVKVDLGSTLMRGAVDNNISGVDADCGGECSCATCHVIVTDSWFPIVGEPAEREKSMLNLNPEKKECSRLSCQIEITGELEGLVVHVPEFQM